MNLYEVKATFGSQKQISQELEAYNSKEAILIFVARSFIENTIEDEDGETKDKLIRIEAKELEK